MAAARGRPDLINVNYRMVCMNRTSMLDEYSHGAHEPNKLAVYFGNVVRICRSSCNYFMRQSKYGLDQTAAVPPTRPNAVRRDYIVGFAFCLVYSHARTQILQAHACLNKCACLLFREFGEYYYTGVYSGCRMCVAYGNSGHKPLQPLRRISMPCRDGGDQFAIQQNCLLCHIMHITSDQHLLSTKLLC